MLIGEFLKCWGLEDQSLEDIIQDLEDVFFREGFELDPIPHLRKALLPEFVETTVKIQEVDDNNEESFECLKESTKQDYKFCEQLIEICLDKDFLVKLCQLIEEEYDVVLEYYEERPTLKSAWEVVIAYYGMD
jgi:hypothetical protein